MGTLSLLRRDEIDIDRWNACVQQHPNGLVYTRSEFLDTICVNWDAVVYNNYEAVLPLPWKNKFGLRYVYVPPFTLQMGIVGPAELSTESEWAQAISRRFRYADVLLNFGNGSFANEKTSRKNYVLNLHRPYAEIKSGFSGDVKRNLKLAERKGLLFSKEQTIDTSILMFSNHYRQQMGIKQQDFHAFLELCMNWQPKGMAFTRSVTDEQGTTIATALFLKDEKRIYNVMNTTTTEGRKKRANHLLLASVLEEFSGSALLFDFEGSDLPGVDQFYQGFGAQLQPYFYWCINNLPSWLQFIKKQRRRPSIHNMLQNISIACGGSLSNSVSIS